MPIALQRIHFPRTTRAIGPANLSPVPCESAFNAGYRRSRQIQSPDREMASLAGRQHGVVSRLQLIDLGMTKSAIERRKRVGRLHVLHPGVYAVGHLVVSNEGYWLAAVLRGGDRAVLSHRSAAALWGVLRGGHGGPVEITTPRSTRSHGGIRRRCMRLSGDEVTVRRRIPVTTLARTLLDLAAVLRVERLEAAVREAEYLHRFQVPDLSVLLERHPGRRGTATARTCLRRLGIGPGGRVRSGLEVRFAALLAQTDLPTPSLNTALAIDGWQVEADCLWRDQRVIVELDGNRAHGTRVAFEKDRERDRRLMAAGWRVVRVTWRQLEQPELLIADLRRLLAVGPTLRDSAPAAA